MKKLLPLILLLIFSCDETVVAPDTTAPTVVITYPANNSTLDSTATVTVDVADDGDIGIVKLLVDGVETYADTTAPYQFQWDVCVQATGTHTLMAKTEDGAGNQGQSDLLTFTIDANYDCESVCGGDKLLDNCEVCDADTTNDCTADCNGDWGGTLELDECGVCGGGGVVDECGTCDDNSSNDCVQDECGFWGGNNLGCCESDDGRIYSGYSHLISHGTLNCGDLYNVREILNDGLGNDDGYYPEFMTGLLGMLNFMANYNYVDFDNGYITRLYLLAYSPNNWGSTVSSIDNISDAICELEYLEKLYLQAQSNYHTITSLPQCICDAWNNGELELEIYLSNPEGEIQLYIENGVLINNTGFCQ